MLGANKYEIRLLRKIAGNRKIHKIRIRESCCIQPINEWVETKRIEWDEHVTRMERLRD